MLVIGVDPGSVKCGYAVLRRDGSTLDYVDAGVIHATAGWPSYRRLIEIGKELEQLADEVHAKRNAAEQVIVGIEGGFVKGQMGALVSGAARGIATFILGRAFECEIREYKPATVKKAATGDGRAEKDQVAERVQLILGLKTTPSHDCGDALAVAITRARDRS